MRLRTCLRSACRLLTSSAISAAARLASAASATAASLSCRKHAEVPDRDYLLLRRRQQQERRGHAHGLADEGGIQRVYRGEPWQIGGRAAAGVCRVLGARAEIAAAVGGLERTQEKPGGGRVESEHGKTQPFRHQGVRGARLQLSARQLSAGGDSGLQGGAGIRRSEEHTSEL